MYYSSFSFVWFWEGSNSINEQIGIFKMFQNGRWSFEIIGFGKPSSVWFKQFIHFLSKIIDIFKFEKLLIKLSNENCRI